MLKTNWTVYEKDETTAESCSSKDTRKGRMHNRLVMYFSLSIVTHTKKILRFLPYIERMSCAFLDHLADMEKSSQYVN